MVNATVWAQRQNKKVPERLNDGQHCLSSYHLHFNRVPHRTAVIIINIILIIQLNNCNSAVNILCVENYPWQDDHFESVVFRLPKVKTQKPF